MVDVVTRPLTIRAMSRLHLRHVVFLVAFPLLLGSLAAGCEEEKKPKPFKSAKTRKARVEREEKKEKAEKTDPMDEAWNTPPTAGMAKVRLALQSADGMIKGRPSFMAPQFELGVVEQLERIHEEGFRATDRKKSYKFNPNEHGRYVAEVKAGHWKIYVNPLDELWLPWISDVITLKKDESRSIDVKLKAPEKMRPKYE